MKRVTRKSRRGGSRPGMAVRPGQGGGSGTADRDLSVRCKCQKTGQVLTCVNMDCPECLETMCSQVPYRNRKFKVTRRKAFSGGGATSSGGFFSLPSGERNFGQQASLPYQQQLNMNHKSNFSHCGASSNFVHSNFAHSNFAHSNFVRGNTDTIFSGGTSNVGPQDRIFAGNYASGRARVKPMGGRGTLAGGINPTNPADRDAICIYKCSDTEFCSIRAANCDFVPWGECCEEGGAMYGGAMGQF